MLAYSTSICTTGCFPYAIKRKSFQLNLSKTVCLDYCSRCGFNCSSSCSLYCLSTRRLCIDVCCSVFHPVSRVRNQKLSGGGSWFSISSNSVLYIVVWLLLSWCGMLRVALTIGFNCFVFSRVFSWNVAMVMSTFNVWGWSFGLRIVASLSFPGFIEIVLAKNNLLPLCSSLGVISPVV